MSLGGHFWWPIFAVFNSKNGYFETSRKCPYCEAREVVQFEEEK